MVNVVLIKGEADILVIVFKICCWFQVETLNSVNKYE